jgi:hypothetical protein
MISVIRCVCVCARVCEWSNIRYEFPDSPCEGVAFRTKMRPLGYSKVPAVVQCVERPAVSMWFWSGVEAPLLMTTYECTSMSFGRRGWRRCVRDRVKRDCRGLRGAGRGLCVCVGGAELAYRSKGAELAYLSRAAWLAYRSKGPAPAYGSRQAWLAYRSKKGVASTPIQRGVATIAILRGVASMPTPRGIASIPIQNTLIQRGAASIPIQRGVARMPIQSGKAGTPTQRSVASTPIQTGVPSTPI